MANVTITLTEQELRAFEVAKNYIDNGYADNIAMDEEFGDDHYERTHRNLDKLEEKIQRAVWVEEQVAHHAVENPHVPKHIVRKMARDAWKETV